MSYARRGPMAYNPPFVVPVRVNPQLNDAIPLFTGFVMDYADQGSGRNPARGIFLQALQSDQMLLQDVVQLTADIASFFYESQNLNQGQFETALADATTLAVDGMLADLIGKNPAPFQNCMTQEMLNAAQQYMQRMQQVFHDMNNFQNRGRSYNQNPAFGRGNGGGGFQHGGFQQGGGYPPAHPHQQQINSGHWNQPQHQQYNQSPSQDQWNQVVQRQQNHNNRPAGPRADVWDDSPRSRPQQSQEPTRTGNIRVARQPVQAPQATHAVPQRVAVNHQQAQQVVNPQSAARMAGSVTVDGVVFTKVDPSTEWPKVADIAKPWDLVLLQDGTQISPAHKSPWKVTFDPNALFPEIYDPQTHILFHVRDPKGKVTWSAMERNDAMNNYLDHELDPTLRKQAADEVAKNQGRIDATWKLVQNLRPNPESPLATLEPLDAAVEGFDVTAPDVADGFLAASSLGEAFKRIILKMKVDNPKLVKQGGFELYGDRMVLTSTLDPDFDFLAAVSNQEKFVGVMEQMDAFKGDPELKAEVDKRLVNGINHALKWSMGLAGWSIDRFYDDIGDLLIALQETYGDHTMDTFNDHAELIIASSLEYYVNEQDLEDVREMFGLEDELTPLVWRERSSMTYLPVPSTQTTLPVVGEQAVMVTEGAHPELYVTLQAIAKRTAHSDHEFFGRFLTTTDGVVYEVTRGYFDDSVFFIHKAKFGS